MKTKFILHGGLNSENMDEDNSPFYAEILKDTPQNLDILLVPFAKDDEGRKNRAVEKVTMEFNKFVGEKNMIIEIANEADFLNQISRADIVYFHGGVSFRLLEILKKYPGIQRSLKGKVVAGESAGANVWCKYFYSPHADGVFEGLGMLPLKIIPHFKDEYRERLNGFGADMEELLLPEYEFKTFTV